MSATTGYNYQQRGYAPRPISPAGPNRQASTPSPEQLNAARNIAWTHHQELGAYLRSKNGISTRGNAKEKLTRLTKQQFQELSTDVYDELLRRKQAEVNANSNQVLPFLQPQNSFHPKRNQARQKLATLPASRFTDLASDVYMELERRYPEFTEEEQSNPSGPSASPNGYQYAQPQQPNNLNRLGSGRRPMSPPSAEQVLSNQPPMPRPGAQAQPSAANEVLVPNKSTLVEEDVNPRPVSPPGSTRSGRGIHEALDSASPQQQTFGANSRVSEGSSLAGNFIGRYASSASGQPGPSANLDRERQAWAAEKEEEIEKVRSDYEYRLTQLQNKLSAAQRDVEEAQSESARLNQQMEEVQQELKDHSKRSEDQSGQIRAYERDLAELQERATASDHHRREVEDLRAQMETQNRSHDASDDIISELKAEVQGLLDELRTANDRLDAMVNEKEAEAGRSRALEQELEVWKNKCSQLQQPRQQKASGKMDSELYSAAVPDEEFPYADNGAFSEAHVRAFQSSIDSLLLAGRSAGASALLKATNDMVVGVSGLDDDVQAFENTPAVEMMSENDREQLSTLKANCHATLSNLVTAARNHASSSGLSPVSLLDAAASHLSVVVVEMVKQLRVRKNTHFSTGPANNSNSTWPKQANYPSSAKSFGSNLQQLSTSASPQSTSFAQRDPASRSLLSSSTSRKAQNNQPSNGPSSMFTSPNVNGDALHGANSSFGSNTSNSRITPQNQSDYEDQKPKLGYSSSSGSYENKVFDSPPAGQHHNGDDEEESVEQVSDNYADFKRYLEDQTEAIVHSIQSLLSAIRGGIQGQQLDDHLSEIVTIVSSIVAIAKDNLPADTQAQGSDILRELTSNCDKLADLQDRSSGAAFDKATKQAVAGASFAIARSLKQLNLLFPSLEDEELA